MRNSFLFLIYRFAFTLFFAFFFFSSASPVLATSSTFYQSIYALTECNDGIDNDNDGLVDYASDSDCTSFSDTSEHSLTQQELTVRSPLTNIVAPILPDPVLEDVANAEQEFLWSPIGRVLGIEGSTNSTPSPLLVFVLALATLTTGFLSFFLIIRFILKVNHGR